MLSSNMILVTALFLLLSSSTVMSATQVHEGAQKEENYECDVIRMLLEKAYGAEQLLDDYPKIQKLFADGLVDIKAKFRLTSDKVDEEVIIPKKVTEDPNFIFLVYGIYYDSVWSDIFCIGNFCNRCENKFHVLAICPQLVREYHAKIRCLNKLRLYQYPAFGILLDKALDTNFQGDGCMLADYFNWLSSPYWYWCKENISVFDFLSISRTYYDQFSNVTIELEFDLCEKFDSSKCYQFSVALPSETSKAPREISKWRKPAILTLIDPVNRMKIDFLKNVNGKKKKDEL